jgi:lipopolysaccharide transport system permease protein
MSTILRPTRGWVAVDFGELFRYRDLALALANRDIKLRYKQTLLGIVWVIAQPVVAAALLYFAFRVVAKVQSPQGTSFFLFSFAGLLAWNLFSATLTKTSLSMVGNSYLIGKVYFPRLILPISGALATLLDFAVAFGVLLILFGVYGVEITAALLLLPVWIILLLCLAMGAGLIASALTVHYRDVQYILPIIVPFLLYASPVAYDVSQLAPRYQTAFYVLNPLAPLIAGFRWSTIGTPLPDARFLVWSLLTTAAVLMLGAAVFRRSERRLVDVI